MAFLVRKCFRCGIERIQLRIVGEVTKGNNGLEVAASCQSCRQLTVFDGIRGFMPSQLGEQEVGDGQNGLEIGQEPVRWDVVERHIDQAVPDRVAGLFKEACACRSLAMYEAAGSIYRKTIDVATKHLYSHDPRLEGKQPATAARARIRALGDMKILEEDIVELADVAALDGNDAAHDVDPYTAEEAEALEELTADLLDRLFVRPARIRTVKAKQIASGQRKAPCGDSPAG
jgi:hypothetical protein